MIRTNINVDKYCHDCPYFSPTMNHTINREGIHMLFITCERYHVCKCIIDRIKKEEKEND